MVPQGRISRDPVGLHILVCVATNTVNPVLTRGFINSRQLLRHFDLHGVDFGAQNEQEYVALADEFLGGNCRPGVHECNRRNGEIVRYSPLTEEFGVLADGGFILTYFKPRPCHTLPHWEPKVNCHDAPDNLTYFRRECSQ